MTECVFRSDMTVELVSRMGDDASVSRSARVSTQGIGARESDGSVKGLVNYLMREHHGTPFEHNAMTFLVQAPIFVVREFQRHRIGWSWNEESGRYKELEPVFYVPDPARNLVQTGRPGAYTFVAGSGEQHYVAGGQIRAANEDAYGRYQVMLNAGIAREVARMVLPVNLYSSFYATCNARSLMAFLSLRTQDERALRRSCPQWEIQLVARGMENEFAKLFPITHGLFNDWGRVAP